MSSISRRVMATFFLMGAFPAALAALAQASDEPGRAPPSPKVGPDVPSWKFESIRLKDGTVYTGLIQAESDAEIEFVEIFRPSGKPMFAVVRPIDTKQVASLSRLANDERDRLVARFQQFRNRARIEAGRMENVRLDEQWRDGTRYWTAARPWFRVESTAQEDMTRRCVVRLEQVFRAYRQVLPSRNARSSDLRLLLFGTMDEYRQFLRRSGVRLASPAFFATSKNLIVAGSDLNRYAARLEQVRAENEKVRRQYSMLDASFSDRLATVLDRMRKLGYREQEIEDEARMRRTQWQRERAAALKRIESVERQNEAELAAVTRDMFARLYHEAFHAYAKNYVCRRGEQTMPRWLDEGLAQIFESGQLDADALRIDAPDADRLRRLRQWLSSETPPRIGDVLAATENEFLADRRGDAAQRRYLCSWGLAYYLAFERNLLAGDALDRYLANARQLGPEARFVQLVGEPLAKFEQQWRDQMMGLMP